ncbi:MAG: Spy/CpxP family protein refolding chaperone [Sulfurimonas sp.]|jgi:Spy/CpxP family protein refolding chaperone|uniref:Spy/CpxP family protein refolding chaperone n=1 Tax=Sulfurimonas sp. TaxID=2022749 RepID=UPI003562BBD1
MNKRVILSLGLTALLSSSLLANGMNYDKEDKNFKKSHSQMMKHNRNGGEHLMAYVMKLDLSDEQKKKIDAIMQESMKNMPKISDAFSENGFDKKLFVKLYNEKTENKAEKKAQMIESIYAVLNASQKKELKKMLDERVAAKKEFFKNCRN